MTVHDLTVAGYKGFPAKSQQKQSFIIARRLTGADIKATVLGTGAVPANGDTYKIAKLSAKQLITEIYFIVVSASAQSITNGIGYTNNTNASTTAFLSAGANLNAAAVTQGVASRKMMDNDGYYLTWTPSTLASLEDACEVVILAKVVDLSLVGITTAITTPI